MELEGETSFALPALVLIVNAGLAVQPRADMAADRLDLVPGAELGLKTTGPLAQACGDISDNLVFKAARLLRERVPDLKLGDFTLDKMLPVAAGIGGGSADAAAALRLLARLNGLALDDARLVEVARLTGADVPVCLASRACVMTGVGATLQPLSLPVMPCVMSRVVFFASTLT